MTPAEALEIVTGIYNQWAKILESGSFERMEDLLATDFRMTSHIVPGPALNKSRFIEVGKQIANAELRLRTIWAQPIGALIVSRVTLDVKEEFKADLGPGMPSADEITSRLSGHRLAYASAWRQSRSGGWQCFNHHMFGAID